MREQRLAQAVAEARASGLHALAVMPGPNLQYLTGLSAHLSERPILLILPVDGEPWVFCPHFEAERIAAGTGSRRVFRYTDEEGPVGPLARAIAEMDLAGARFGVEFLHMRVLERELLAAAVGGDLRCADADSLFAELRMVKDAGELARIRVACALADEGAAAAAAAIAPGVSEAQVAEQVELALVRRGGRRPFHIHVASGPRAAVPHAETSDRVLQAGELCWVDIFFHHNDYVGDITRTYPVGDVSGEAAAIFRLCLAAQAAARKAARPGITGDQLDGIARGVISRGGYGPRFTHRTGHGIGLEIHEGPYIVAGNHRPLMAGNVFTIEPGIYVPGLGGVRIEDDVALVAGGCQCLTEYPRNLLRGDGEDEEE